MICQNNIFIKYLGGAQEVGRSCVMLNIKNQGILLDAGLIRNSTNFNGFPFLNSLKLKCCNLSIILSHYHMDHSGAIPFIMSYMNLKIICLTTFKTKALFWNNLFSYYLFFKYNNPCLVEDLEISMEFLESFMKGVYYTHHLVLINYSDAGHSIDSNNIMIRFNKFTLLYSGDFNESNYALINSYFFYNFINNLVILENTFGSLRFVESCVNLRTIIRIIKLANDSSSNILIPLNSFFIFLMLINIFVRFNIIEKKNIIDLCICTNINLKYFNCIKNLLTCLSILSKKKWKKVTGICHTIKFTKLNSSSLNKPKRSVILSTPNIFSKKLVKKLYTLVKNPKNFILLTEFLLKDSIINNLSSFQKVLDGNKLSQLKIKVNIFNIFLITHPRFFTFFEAIFFLRYTILSVVHSKSSRSFRLVKQLKQNRRKISESFLLLNPFNRKKLKLRANKQKRFFIKLRVKYDLFNYNIILFKSLFCVCFRNFSLYCKKAIKEFSFDQTVINNIYKVKKKKFNNHFFIIKKYKIDSVINVYLKLELFQFDILLL